MRWLQKSESEGGNSGRFSLWRWIAVGAVVIGIYAAFAAPIWWERNLNPADHDYNLLVAGFRAGQLNLPKEVPRGLADLANPYSPSATARYFFSPARLLDLTYYRGKFYLYFGATPALVLFWPWVALTGRYLSHRNGTVIFCAFGFLISIGLLRALWRRYYPEIGPGVALAWALALGLATGLPFLLGRCGIYEAAVGCAYALAMASFATLWRALHEPSRRGRWLMASSLCYGLAVGARPTLLYGAVLLLIPVAQAWSTPAERNPARRILLLLGAAIGPIALVGAGIALYNYRRFGQITEFGMKYQLADLSQVNLRRFSIHFFWTNFRSYFLEPVQWGSRFPFIHLRPPPPPPAGYLMMWESSFGILPNVPLAGLALALPAMMGRPSLHSPPALRWFLLALAIFFSASALTLGCFWFACERYQIDFLPALLLLAAAGMFALNRSAIGRPRRQRCLQGAFWGLLLWSVAFNILYGIENRSYQTINRGNEYVLARRWPEAMELYRQALKLDPDFAEAHLELGRILGYQGRTGEAILEFKEALRLKPDWAVGYLNLGTALEASGRPAEAIVQFNTALRLNPSYLKARTNLGSSLAQVGRYPEALAEFEQVFRLGPDDPRLELNWGNALFLTGRVQEAVARYEAALNLDPNFAGVRENLALARNTLAESPGKKAAP